MKDRDAKLLVGIEEAARLLDLAPSTLYNEISRQRHGKTSFLKIKAVKVGGKLIKFRMADLVRYVDSLPTE